MKMNLAGIGVIAAAGMMLSPMASAVESITDAFKEGKAGVSFRLRYEDVDQPEKDMSADALTLRSRLSFQTADFYGVGSFIEFDNVNAWDYSNYKSGTNTGDADASTIKDPEYTQVNQAYLSYSKWDTVAKYGRQRIVLDNQRFIGNVGFRQNEQTYDAFSVTNKSVKNLSIFAAKVFNVNTIVNDGEGDASDTVTGTVRGDDKKSDHLLLNVQYKVFDPLTITGYAYNLDNIVSEDTVDTRDTVGLRLTGTVPAGPVKIGYTAEFAAQEYENEADGTKNYEADYSLLEASVAVVGVTVKLGNELLGADDTDAAGTAYNSFQTPLATLHAHNGWADMFLATPANGLNDTYLSVGGTIPGEVNITGVFHTYTADEEAATGEDDLGDEFDLIVSRKFGAYGVEFKYASYSEGDAVFAPAYTETEKFWITATADF